MDAATIVVDASRIVDASRFVDGAADTDSAILGDARVSPPDADVSAPEVDPRPEPSAYLHLLSPQSVSRVTSQRPVFRWVQPDDTHRARITLARDRALTRGVRRAVVTERSWRATEPLEPGVWFWQVEALDDDGRARVSPTWEFRAPRVDTAVVSSWGTLRDLDGDGFDDLVAVGRNDVDVYLGAPTGIPVAPTLHLTAPMDESLWSLAPRMGDVNGDGLGDFAVAVVVTRVIPSEFYPEHLWVFDVYLGGPVTGVGDRGTRLAPHTDDGFDHIIDLLGVADLDGDDFSDVILQDNRYGDYSCADHVRQGVVIFRGGPHGVSTSQTTLRSECPLLGWRGADVGDVNRDGFIDVSATGVLFLAGLGDALPFSSSPGGPDDYDAMGPIGDVNGDGFVDMAGSMGNGTNVYLGREGFVAAPPDQRIVPPEADDVVLQAEFAGPADVNGDGYADLVSLHSHRDYEPFGACCGRVYVNLGSAEGLRAAPAFTWDLSSTGELRAREAMTTGLDLNGDGLDDFVIDHGGRENSTTVYEGHATSTMTPGRVLSRSGPSGFG